MAMTPRTSILTIPLLAVACAGPQPNPPSLAPRAIEGVLERPVQVTAPVASADDAALAARIAGLVDEAVEGERAFSEALPEARQAIAAAEGDAAQSEDWIVAQVALSALDGYRAPTTRALGELDAILAEQTLAGEPAETEVLIAARDRVASLYASQVEAYEALAGRLRTP